MTGKTGHAVSHAFDTRGNALPILVGVVLVLVLGAGLAFLVLGPSGSSDGALTPELAQGQALYEVNCAECHGVSATGDGPLAASLPVQPPSVLDHLVHHTEDVLVRIVQTGIPPAMPPIPVSDDEGRLLFGYLETLLPEGQSIGSMGSMDMPMGGMPMDHENMDMPMGGQGGGMPGMPMGGRGGDMPMGDSSATPR